MKARLAGLTALTALLLGIFGGVAAADNNGQAIGQDPISLLETICGNAGAGNSGEIFFEDGDDEGGTCFKDDKNEAHGSDQDPGNSADHNNAPAVPPGVAP